ncbi:MAG: 6,7-dimethyl-8-ribityllumazine synthase [Phycisphaerales bacterium]
MKQRSRSTKPARRGTEGPARAAGVAIVVSRYNESITSRLRDGAVRAFTERGGSTADLAIFDAPGSFDLTAICDAAASSGRFAGIVALGCIIKGDTSHDQHIASAVVHGLTNITILTGVPIALGVLTVNTAQQARERAGVGGGGGKHGNKGAEAMNALLLTLAEIDRVRNHVAAARVTGHVLPDKGAPRSITHRGGR